MTVVLVSVVDAIMSTHVASFTHPPLTTIDIEERTIGSMAARRLCMLLDEPDDESWLMVVPTTLIPRDSTA
jgi:DNA-binding LacI/PurR family transcriptional regulator